MSQNINPVVPIKLTNSVTLLPIDPALRDAFSGYQQNPQDQTDENLHQQQVLGSVKKTNVVIVPSFWGKPPTVKVETTKQNPQENNQAEAQAQVPGQTGVMKTTVINIPLCIIA